MKRLARNIYKIVTFKKDWKVIFAMFMTIISIIALFLIPAEIVEVAGESGVGIKWTFNHVALFINILYFSYPVLKKIVKVYE